MAKEVNKLGDLRYLKHLSGKKALGLVLEEGQRNTAHGPTSSRKAALADAVANAWRHSPRSRAD